MLRQPRSLFQACPFGRIWESLQPARSPLTAVIHFLYNESSRVISPNPCSAVSLVTFLVFLVPRCPGVAALHRAIAPRMLQNPCPRQCQSSFKSSHCTFPPPSNSHKFKPNRYLVIPRTLSKFVDDNGNLSDSKPPVSSTLVSAPVVAASHALSEIMVNLEASTSSSNDSEPTGDFSVEDFEDEGLGKAGGKNKATFEVLRLDKSGKARQCFARRRDLLKEHRLQPRDFRRIDLTVDSNKAPPSITIKDNVILLCLGGVRMIVTADKALLFEPQAQTTRKFLEVVQQLVQARQQTGQELPPAAELQEELQAGASHSEYMSRYYQNYQQKSDEQAMTPAPFELEVLEAALTTATGRLDGQMAAVTRRVQLLMKKLPQDISPMNLEELRKVKGALVELEQRADTLRDMLEELMDDEDELRELNLTSRPRREERQRQRERERLERELERAREIREEIEERLEDDGQESGSSSGSKGGSSSTRGSRDGAGRDAALHMGPGGMPFRPSTRSQGSSKASGAGKTSFPAGYPRVNGMVPRDFQGGGTYASLHYELDQSGKQKLTNGSSASAAPLAPGIQLPQQAGAAPLPANLSQEQRKEQVQDLRAKFDRARLMELRSKFNWTDRDRRDEKDEKDSARDQRRSRNLSSMDDMGNVDREDWISRLEGSNDDIQEAQEALEEMVEAEEEEQEVEEVEDLLEYYLQRASTTQDEAERLLAGARDLEESIGVSLSARRYEVNRLELTLSIGSFAATLGAMVAGIFGMNMRSKLEASVMGFWGVGVAIVLGCLAIFLAVLKYTQQRRIL